MSVLYFPLLEIYIHDCYSQVVDCILFLSNEGKFNFHIKY